MGVKISELPVVPSANKSDSLVLNHGDVTRRITLENLMASYLSEGGLVTEAALSETLGGYVAASEIPNYLSQYVTKGILSEAIDGYMSSADLSNYLSEALNDYMNSSELDNYLSEALSAYMLSSDLSEALTEYVSSSSLDSYLSDYISSSQLDEYINTALSSYVTSEHLSDSLSGYLSTSDIEPYLSEGLAGLSHLLSASDLDEAGYVSSSSFAAALAAYLSEYGGETIYDAISQYIHQEG